MGPARGDSLAQPRQNKQINAAGEQYALIKGRKDDGWAPDACGFAINLAV